MAERHFIVLYTHQKTKKAKTWHDGILKMPTAGSKGILYDDKGMKIDSIHVRPQDLNPGEQLESDRHYIMVEEEKTNSTGSNEVTVRTSETAVNQRRTLPLPRPQNAVRVGLKRKRTGFNPPRMIRPNENSSDGAPDVRLETEMYRGLHTSNQLHCSERNKENSFHLRFKHLQRQASNMQQHNSSDSASLVQSKEPYSVFETESTKKSSSVSPISTYCRNSSTASDLDSSVTKNDHWSSPQQKLSSPWSTYGRNSLNKRNSPVNEKVNVIKDEERTYLYEDPSEEPSYGGGMFDGSKPGKIMSYRGLTMKKNAVNECDAIGETSTKRNAAQILALMRCRSAEAESSLNSVRPQSLEHCVKETPGTVLNYSSKNVNDFNMSYEWVETPMGSQVMVQDQNQIADNFEDSESMQKVQSEDRLESGMPYMEAVEINNSACIENQNEKCQDLDLQTQNYCSLNEEIKETIVDDEEEDEEDMAGIVIAQPDFHISFSPLSQISSEVEDSSDKDNERCDSNVVSQCSETIASTIRLCNDQANSASNMMENIQILDSDMRDSSRDLSNDTEHVVDKNCASKNTENDTSLSGKVVNDKSSSVASGLASCQQKEREQDVTNEPMVQEDAKDDAAAKEEVIIEDGKIDNVTKVETETEKDGKEDEEHLFQEDCTDDHVTKEQLIVEDCNEDGATKEQLIVEDGKENSGTKEQLILEDGKENSGTKEQLILEDCKENSGTKEQLILEDGKENSGTKEQLILEDCKEDKGTKGQLILEDGKENSGANKQLIQEDIQDTHITTVTNNLIESPKTDSQGSFHTMKMEGNLNKLDFSQDSLAKFSLFSSEEIRPCMLKHFSAGNQESYRTSSLPFSDVEFIGSNTFSQESKEGETCNMENSNPLQSMEESENFHSADEIAENLFVKESTVSNEENALTEIGFKASEDEPKIGYSTCILSQDRNGSLTSVEVSSSRNSSDREEEKYYHGASILTVANDSHKEILSCNLSNGQEVWNPSQTKNEEDGHELKQEHFVVKTRNLPHVSSPNTSTEIVQSGAVTSVQDELNLCQTLENPSIFANSTNHRTDFVRRESTPQGLVDKLSEKLTSYKMKGSLSGVGAKRQTRDRRNLSACRRKTCTLEGHTLTDLDRSLVCNMKDINQALINEEETSFFHSSLLPTELQIMPSNHEFHGSCQRVPSGITSPQDFTMPSSHVLDAFPVSQEKALLNQSINLDDLEEECKEFVYRRPHERKYFRSTPCKKERKAMISEPFSDTKCRTDISSTSGICIRDIQSLNSPFVISKESSDYPKSQQKMLPTLNKLETCGNKENEKNNSNSTCGNSIMFADRHVVNQLGCDTVSNSKWGKFMQEEDNDELDSLLNCSFDLKTSPNYKVPSNYHTLRTVSNDDFVESPNFNGTSSRQLNQQGSLNLEHQEENVTTLSKFTSNQSVDIKKIEDQNSGSQECRKGKENTDFAVDNSKERNWILRKQEYEMRSSERDSPNFDVHANQKQNFQHILSVPQQTKFSSHNTSVSQFSPLNSFTFKERDQTLNMGKSFSRNSHFQISSQTSSPEYSKEIKTSPDEGMSTVSALYTADHGPQNGMRKSIHEIKSTQCSNFAISQRRDMQRGFQSPLITAEENANILKGSKRSVFGELQFATMLEVEQNAVPQRHCIIPCKFPSVAVYRQILTAALKEHLNIILFALAENYHHSMAKIDTSAYQNQPSGPNRGKASTHTSSNPVCNCGAPSKMIQVKKEGPNKGRFFFACNAQRNQQCKFFHWADQESKSGGPSSSANSRMKMSDAGNITTYLRSQHVYFYGECQFLKKTMENIMNHFRRNVPKWVKDKYAAKNNTSEKKKYIRLSKKDSSSLFSKDDLWIISQHFDFEPAHSFLAKSVYFGPTSGNEVEIEPVTSFSPSNWPNEGNCHAILCGNISSELSYVENLQENLQFSSVPILPHLLNREGELQTSKVFRAPVRTNLPSNIHCPDDLVESLASEFVEKYKLNPGQEEALRRVSHMFCKSKSMEVDPVLLVHGVFGAGKSFLLSLVIMFLVRVFELNDTYSPGVPFPWKVLVSSTTNVAVDRILNGLLDLGFEDFVRVGSVKKIAKPVLPYSVHATGTENQELKDLQEMLRSGDLSMAEKHHVRQSIEKHRLGENKKRLQNVKVVGVTCASCSANSLKGMNFPIVILDECSQMTEPASLVPIAKFGCEKLLLVGDPKQLDPTIQGSESSHTQGLEQTLFDRLITMGHVPTILRTQYRCHPAISNIPNTLFYNKQLIDGISTQDRRPLKNYLPTVCFYDVYDGVESMDTDGSFSNAKEADFVVFLIENLVTSGVEPSSIGVITLYKSQMHKIIAQLGTSRNCSQKETKSTLVSTVDAFQGGERDIIILSCVRTKSVGFIDNEKRTNVALTRARHHMLIVGNKTNLKKNKLWGKIINLCESNPDGIQEASEAERILQAASEEACTSSIGTVTSSMTENEEDGNRKKKKRGRKRKMKNAKNEDSQESSPPMSLSESQHSEVSRFSPGSVDVEDLTSDVNLDDNFTFSVDTVMVKRRNKIRLIDPNLIESDKDISDEELPMFG